VQPGQIGGEGCEPRRPHFAGIGVDQQRRANLDDDAAEVFERGEGHQNETLQLGFARAVPLEYQMIAAAETDSL